MDPKLFSADAPGRIVPVDLGIQGKNWAFIPHDLPPAWEFPARLWPLLTQAKEALGTLNGIGQVLPHPQLLLRPLQTREAITSSSIEGTYVTPKQLLLYELDPQEPQTADERAADWKEVANYRRALTHGYELLSDIPICKRLIRELHETLMSGVRGEKKAPGRFRDCQVQIGSRARFVPAPHIEVEGLLDRLERYIHGEDEQFDPLVRSYLVHYQFEAIHPFKDGNGRIGRVLLALMTSLWHGHSQPWLYMSAYFEKYREEYVENLFQISTVGAWEQWIEFCLRGTVVQANDSIRRCHAFLDLRMQYLARIESPSARTHQLIEMLFDTPIITISWVSRAFQIAYHTAQADIERLVKAGILMEVPDEYPRTFGAKELIEAAYGDEMAN